MKIPKIYNMLSNREIRFINKIKEILKNNTSICKELQ